MSGRLRASPLARRLAAERGVDLAGIVGSGPDGRIVAADLPAAQASSVAPGDAMFGPGLVPLRRTIVIDARAAGTEPLSLLAWVNRSLAKITGPEGPRIAVSDLGALGVDTYDPTPPEDADAALGIGAARRAPVVAPDGTIRVATACCLILTCNTDRLSPEEGARLLDRIAGSLAAD